MVNYFKEDNDDNEILPTFGSRYTNEPIPKYELPTNGMPSKVAYQMIHDELQLDGHPAQNLASFVTTWMEPKAERLIIESLQLNLADEDEYPHVIKIQKRCVNILARLFNGDPEKKPVGTSAVGSSEAIMLAGLAMKWRWRKKNPSGGKPNIIMGENVQVVWEKFARYFEVEPRLIPVEDGRYTVSAEEVVKLCDENTIGVCAILGSTFTGEFEPIEEISKALDKLEWDIPIHVDAASGGFVAPFLYPNLKWDFRIDRVVSINVSGHKYGLVYPGIGWVLWRSEEDLPEELVFHVNYLGGDMPTFTLNFSRPSAFVVAQYYNFLALGHEGYARIMQNLKSIADYIGDEVEKFEDFTLLSDRKSLPLVAWRLSSECPYDAFALSDKLREYGWIVPAYTMPKNAEHLAILRVVVREHLSRDLAENLVLDLHRADQALRVSPPKKRTTEQKSRKVC
ncbi:MAG: glutamate decarboxylase [Simkaniaceae bacterium]|nr:glutamate decarboxylase [Simkaniaceae bacterium]